MCASELALGACFPESCNNKLAPNPGSLKINHISKCHSLIWVKGQNAYFLTDPDGNKYILGSSGSREQSDSGVLDPAPQLPEGWFGTTVVLEEDIQLLPDGDSTLKTQAGDRKKVGEFACGQTFLWDEHGNQYYQIEKTTGTQNLKLNLLFRGFLLVDIVNIVFAAIIVSILTIVGCVYKKYVR